MERRWGSPDAATAAVRHAVRAALADLGPGDLVLAACSGGADSLALAAALAFEAPAAGLRAGAVVVDHGLQHGSARVAADAADCLRALGLDPVDVVRSRSRPPATGSRRPPARPATPRSTTPPTGTARSPCCSATPSTTRPSRCCSASPAARGPGPCRGCRPPAAASAARCSGVTREQCRASAAAEGLTWWDDPMNEDPAFTRVRARRAVADLERDLGPGVAAALARTASQLRDDADHLDGLADAAAAELGPQPWAVEALAGIPRAVRTRTWRRLLVAAGAPAGRVGTRHTDACDRLLTAWHGQGPVHAPGDLLVARSGGRVTIAPADRVD